MSFIDFESGWEKEKARQELREVRAELLKRVIYLKLMFSSSLHSIQYLHILKQ